MAKKRGVPAHGRESARFHRARKKRYLVVAGGAVTERQYFKQLESIYDVVIDYQQKNESPEQLADFACKLKKEGAADIFLEIITQPFLGFDGIVPGSSNQATV